jgi:hypothetical protein
MPKSLIVLPDEILQCKDGVLLNYRRGLTLNWLAVEPWCGLWKKVYWEGQVHPRHPLMWEDRKTGLLYMADKHRARTDLGSIPPPVQQYFPPAEAPYAYYPHDSGYKDGGLWVAPSLDAPWTFKAMSRKELDVMCLCNMLHAGGMSLPRRSVVYSSVRTCGWSAWNPKNPVPHEH